MLFGVHQHLFAAGAAAGDVDRWPDAAVDQAAIEDDFLIAGPFELLEDDFVHLAAGVDQRRGDDRERSAILDAASRAEKPLGPLHRVGIDTTGKDLAGVRALSIPRPGEPRD